MHKSELRKEILARRKECFSPEVSALICQKAASLSAFKKANAVMLYLSNRSEVDTTRLIALSHRFGKKICFPQVLNEEKMDAVSLEGNGFSRGAFGIWEPNGIPVNSIDLIFVPGVVFDIDRNRIGYGKGYYDRFLRNSNATTIGLAFSCQIVPQIPKEPHDIQLDMILTEEGIIT